MYANRHPPYVLHLHQTTHSALSSPGIADPWPYPIYQSDRITDRKSIFQAHVSAFPSPPGKSTTTKAAAATHSPGAPAPHGEHDQQLVIDDLLHHLKTQPQLKRATHMMYAYRTSGGNVSGQGDGGESGSGDRLARLLLLAHCQDVAVVVSRWYGGVPLGSDRWKRISFVAKEALTRGGYLTKIYAGKGKKPSRKGST